eukprot:jgi/Phyca11/573005/estExt2_Genewise1.C_PHYCAscaffold_500382
MDNTESDSSSSASFESDRGLNPDRRRKEGPVRYTTSLQRRKKAELKALMEEAQQLNTQLQQMQLSRLSRIGINPSASRKPNMWRSLAMIESESRERAERTNRELKAIMANQINVNASINKILGRRNLLEGMDFVFNVQDIPDRRLQPLDFSDAILAELSNSLGKLRLEADNVLPVMEENPPISCRSQNRNLKSDETCVETTSITPLECSMHKAAEYLWHHITTKKNKDTQKSFRFVRSRNLNSLERNCMASLPNGNNLLLNLDGVNIVRKYEEANQVVLVGTTTWFLPTGGLQFEDHHWTIISPSQANPLGASVVRSCYQLQVKRVDTSSVLPMDFGHVKKLVLNAIGGKLRNVLQLQQTVLLEK